MFVNNENWEDCKKYFEKTYVKFTDLTGDQLWKIVSVDPSYIMAENSNKETAGIQLDLGYNIDYVIPKKTIFQHGEYATMLSRIPARMWKKGLSDVNTQFEVLTREYGWKKEKFDIKIIEGFINKPCYYSVQDALKEFKSSEHLQSAAITPRMALSCKGGIFIDNVLIGKLADKKESISVKKVFLPEITQSFGFLGINIKTV